MDFLKLLGEDEHDVAYHKRAPAFGQQKDTERKPGGRHKDNPARQEQRDFEAGGQEGAYTKGQGKDSEGSEPDVTKWSWIGNRSPLMGDKEEAQWLLEKFFQRLEESLKSEGSKTTATVDGNKTEGGSDGSEKTMGKE